MDFLLDERGLFVCLYDCDVFGKEKMELYEQLAAGVPVAEMVIPHPILRSLALKDRVEARIDFRIAFIHQSTDGTTDQLSPRPENIQCNENRENGVERQPAGEHRQYQSDDYPHACPAVG